MTRRTAAERGGFRAVLAGFAAVLALAALGGCGYSTQSSLDPKYNTIAVSPFYDKTREYDLQAPLTDAVIRKFINDSRLQVVKAADADLLLEGMITGLTRRGLITDHNDEVTQSLMVVTAGVRLTDRATGQVLWEDPAMAGETSFYTRAAGLSSDRLRGNAEVFLPTVRSFPTEEENRAASEALEQLATVVFHRVVEPW
jgi:hypothetical protein